MQFGNGDNMRTQVQVEKDLRIHQSRHESIMRQKSRELWLDKGDRNTAFFHPSVLNR